MEFAYAFVAIVIVMLVACILIALLKKEKKQ